MNDECFEEKLSKIVKKSEVYQYPNSVSFTEEADNYGFSWTPSMNTLLSSASAKKNESDPQDHSTNYLKVLQSDPVFYNPGSHQLMLECYGIEPYFSFQYGVTPLTWNYKDLNEHRNQRISTQLTIDGIDLCRKGKYAEALNLLKQALDLFATNVDALVAIGACHANIGNLKEAILHLETALSLNPNDRNALLYLEKTKSQLARRNTEVPISHPDLPPTNVDSPSTIDNGEKKHHKKDKHKKRKYLADDQSSKEEKSDRKKEKKHKKKKRKSKKSKSSSSTSSTTSSPPPTVHVEESVHPILTRSKNSFWG